MTRDLHLDFETRSEADLKVVGAHAYFEHPSTRVLCAAYAFDDEEPDIWYPDDIFFPERIKQHVADGGVITAWNAAFERLAWRHVMGPRHSWGVVEDKQWQCTMTEALSMNMPGQLKDAAPAFGLDMIKDDAGHRLMLRMCKPLKPRKGEPKDDILWHEDPAAILRLGEYCKQDVRVEAKIGRRVLRLRPSERKLYLLDMKINDRGVFIDKKLCQSAQKIVETATDRLDDEMRRVTDNAVSACSSVVQLVRWLASRGVTTESVDREHIEDLLILELPDDCRRALELRQEGSKTSTAKIGAMLKRQQSDGRMRGNLQFCGAAQTLRWAARGAQLQNLTRPKILGSKEMGPMSLDDQIENAIQCIHNGSSIALEIIYGQPLTLVADCVRSMVCAPAGRILRSSDFANIEGRCVAWLAGQEDKLGAFRAFDAGTGPDLYLVAAAAIYGVPINEAKPYRQVGKVSELALGYGGGPRAFAKMAKGYGVRIEQLYDGIWDLAADEFRDLASSAWNERGRKTGMSERGWMASEVIKLAWRSKNWRIAAYWKEVEDAAINAVRAKGVVYTAGRVAYRCSGSFLFCMLPSGHAICYPYPRLKEKETPWGEMRPSLVFKSINQFTRRWQDKDAYGGMLVENLCQAISRDIMAEAMVRVDEAGYPVVLTVHDEVVTESQVGYGSMGEFNALMTKSPVWADEFPIAVGGWEGPRYHK